MRGTDEGTSEVARDGETAGLHVCPLRAGGQPAL